jgi:hypothetical protein
VEGGESQSQSQSQSHCVGIVVISTKPELANQVVLCCASMSLARSLVGCGGLTGLDSTPDSGLPVDSELRLHPQRTRI